jgi:large subunit ribosomal protein L4
MGGGVAHGPKPRPYGVRVNKKMKRLALRSALSDAVRSDKVFVVQGLAFEGPRTKDAVVLLDALGAGGRVLLVLDRPDEAAEKSFRNLDYVRVGYPGNLGTYDLLYADSVVFTSEALDALTGEETAPFEEPVPGEGDEGGGQEPRREEERLQPAPESGPDAAAEPAPRQDSDDGAGQRPEEGGGE